MPSGWLGPQNGEKGPWKGRRGAGSGRTQRHREAVDQATNLHGLGGKEAGKLEALGGDCLGGEVQGRTQSWNKERHRELAQSIPDFQA